MFTEEEINKIFQDKLTIYRKHKDSFAAKDKSPYPDLHPCYGKTIDLWEAIRVHSCHDHLPEKLFKKKAPNEHPLEFEYRRENYQPYTRTTYREGVSNINRVFNPQNYSISGWKNDDGIWANLPAKEYFETDYPESGSIVNYFKHVVKSAMLEDANGVVAVDIHNLDQIAVNDTIEPEPVLHIYHSNQVWVYTRDYALLELDHKSMVQYGNTTRKTGLVFKFYDKNNIWIITQVGKEVEWTFTIEEYYPHNLESLPAWKLKGIPEKCEGETIYKSFINDCVYPLNQALYDSSTLDMAKVAFAFPERWQYVQKCDTCEGVGKLWNEDKQDNISCTTCQGSGRRKPSVFNIVEIEAPSNTHPETLDPPPFGYVNKDAAILEFLDKQIEKRQELSFSFMGIEISKDRASGKETATGRLIDRETLFSFLLDVSNNIFELLKESIWAMGRIRYGKSTFVMPEIKSPTNFAIRSEETLLKEIGEAKQSNTPAYILSQMYSELLNVRFSSETQTKLIGELQKNIDPYYILSFDEVIRLKAVNIAPEWKVQLHLEFDNILNELMEADDNFLSKTFPDIKAAIETKAKGLVQTTGSTEDILKIATG